MTADIAEVLRGAPGPDLAAAGVLRTRATQVLRPSGALARLDEIAVWLGAWQRTARPRVAQPSLLVFVGDHGVAAEGVSAYPSDVTAAMLKALEEGVATANAMAAAVGASVHVFDVGVGNPTASLAGAPALGADRFRECFDTGRRAVTESDADLLVLGEMGIGNTTAASAVTAALLGVAADACTGRGTGVDDAAYERKKAVVAAASRRVAEAAPLEILREVGGTELAAIAGAAVEARLRSIPVVLDGFVVCASVAPLEVLRPGALDNSIAGHRSSEPGHALLLERLGKRPLLDLDMRLGEGSGALATIPLIKLAAAAVTDVATFDEWGVEQR